MKKAKIIGTIVGVIFFVAAIAGITYAWFTWQSSNINVSGNTGCFTIDYGIGQEIGVSSSEPLKLATSYTEGLYAEVSLGLNDKCTGISGKGTLYLNTNPVGTDTAILTGALKYTAVSISGQTSNIIAEGVITSTDKIVLATNIDLDTETDDYTYRVYVWIDGEIADNTYANAKYSGYISAEAIQNAQ